MLEVQVRSLEATQSGKLQKWLLSPEYYLLRQALLAEVTVLQATASNVITRNADAIRAQAGLDTRASQSLTQAARLQTCLDILATVSSEGYQFKTAEVHITDKHDN
jgi:hypothetical protein